MRAVTYSAKNESNGPSFFSLQLRGCNNDLNNYILKVIKFADIVKYLFQITVDYVTFVALI